MSARLALMIVALLTLAIALHQLPSPGLRVVATLIGAACAERWWVRWSRR